MCKNRPTELNKKIKRLEISRNGLKINNRKKNLINQKLRDRNVEITESRDKWKTRHKKLRRENIELEQQVQAAQEETERQRIRADKERERADKLQAEIEIVWGKKSGA